MKIRFYGKLADLVGHELQLETSRCTIAQLREQIIEYCPAAEGALTDRRVRACVRDVMLKDDDSVETGECVEFLAAVSGG